jgi:predicted nucleic acid-binding protein
MKAFIDTNVLIYWVDAGERADVVEQLLSGNCVISVQVLNEFANVLIKKRAMPLAFVQELSQTLSDVCEVLDLSLRTHQSALVLMKKYKLSLYDANIVAAALLSDCSLLYSEDMQDGLNIKLPGAHAGNSLSIRNPFLAR